MVVVVMVVVMVRFRSTCGDASSRRAAVLSRISLSGRLLRPVRSSYFVAPRVGPFFRSVAPARTRVAPQCSTALLGSVRAVSVFARPTAAPTRRHQYPRPSDVFDSFSPLL